MACSRGSAVRSASRRARRSCARARSMRAGGSCVAPRLERVGADQLARAAVIAGPAAVALLAPHVPDALARIALPPRVGQLGPDRAVARRCAGLGFVAGDVLARIAARTIAPWFATD